MKTLVLKEPGVHGRHRAFATVALAGIISTTRRRADRAAHNALFSDATEA